MEGKRLALRKLDVDDLIILRGLSRGLTQSAIADYLSVCAPAVSQRVKKIESVFGDKLLTKHTPWGYGTPTELCLMVGAAASESLACLEELHERVLG